MWKRADLKERAKGALRANYWKAVLTSAVVLGVFGGSGTAAINSTDSEQIVEGAASISVATILILALFIIALVAVAIIVAAFVFNPVEIGAHKFRINAINGKGNVSDLGYGYDTSYKRNVKVLLVRNIYIVLWYCLFIIPGIIKSYEYYMIPYLLADNPDMSRSEAFKKSKEMMRGNKWKAFVLSLSFIPWNILGFITLGMVNIFYVYPYKHLTSAALYEELKNKKYSDYEAN